jgi:NAD(P)H-dependent FMN reductase
MGEDAVNDIKRVAVVVASTRPTRICPGISTWLQRELRSAHEASSPVGLVQYGSIDLAEVNLPFLDEPLIPALGQYQHEHTKAWSRTVSGYDGFVFVLPQYNWGYPAVLKNALDFLFEEWDDKPVTFATYGTHGGSMAAAQLQTVLAGLHMRELDDHLEIVITLDDLDRDWQVKDLEAVLAPYREHVRRIDRQLLDALTAAEAPITH